MSTSDPSRSRVARPASLRSNCTRWPCLSILNIEPSRASSARSTSAKSASLTTTPSPVTGS